MTLLAPSALWLLPLLAVIAASYLLRMPRKRLVVPTTQVWLRLAEVSRKTRRRARTLVSLGVQAGIFLLLLGAASRPYLHRGTTVGPRRVVIVLDQSASMGIRDGRVDLTDAAGLATPGTRTRFDVAREVARRLASGLEQRGAAEDNDQLLLLTAGAQAKCHGQFTDDEQTFREALAPLQPGDVTADLAGAALLVERLAAAFPDLEVFLLSDGQFDEPARAAWQQLTSATPPATPVLRKLVYVPCGATSPNLGLTRFAARRNLDAPGNFEAVLEVLNPGPESRSCKLEFRLAEPRQELSARLNPRTDPGAPRGTLIDAVRLEVPAQGRVFHVLRQSDVAYNAILHASLVDRGGADVFALDDAAAAVLPAPRRARIALVTDRADDPLVAVLRANVNLQAYRFPASAKVDDLPVDGYFYLDCLPAKWPRNHVLLINSSGRVPLAAGGTGEAAGGLLVNERLAQPRVRGWNRDHPVMNAVSLRNLLLDEALRLPTGRGVEVVARTETAPLIVSLEQDGWKVVYLGFDPRRSDLMFRQDFPLLIDSTVRYFLAGTQQPWQPPVIPGQAWRQELKDRLTGPWAPDGTLLVAEVTGRNAVLRSVEHAGVYLYRDGQTVDGFAANLTSPVESAVATVPTLGLGEQTVYPAAVVATRVKPWLWPYLAALGGVLLTIECYLHHRRIAF